MKAVHQSFCEHLSDLTIHPLDNHLVVEGASGQLVPYLGYIELHVIFPKDFVGTDIKHLGLSDSPSPL